MYLKYVYYYYMRKSPPSDEMFKIELNLIHFSLIHLQFGKVIIITTKTKRVSDQLQFNFEKYWVGFEKSLTKLRNFKEV